MGLFYKDYATKVAEDEKKETERKQRAEEFSRDLKEARRSAVMEQIDDFGLAFDDYDDDELEDRIKANIIALNDLVAFGGLSDVELLYKQRPQTGAGELLNLLVKQNWIIIQQNERIARLLERD